MDCVRAIKTVLDIIQKPIDLAREHRRLGRKLENGLRNLKNDLDIMKEDLKSYQELQLLELVYDIEDFVLGLWIPEASGIALSAVAMDPREDYLDRIESFQERIKRLEKRIERLEKRQEKSPESRSERGGGCSADASRGDDPASSSAAGEYTPEELLVGISEHKKVLLDLLQKSASSEQAGGGQDDEQPPKVISIVGCPGVGKTALARVVYDHACASDEFECVAWVEASGCNDKTALLGKIREEVQADLARRASAFQSKGDDGTAGALRGILADKRYLVFIDDVQQAKMWKDTVRDFPENGKSSMLIVTTSVHSVADAYSSGSYVYTMKCLGDTESKVLLWRHVYSHGRKPAPSLCNGSESIITKCGGLPLALISVAEHLSINPTKLDRDFCVRVGKELGSHYLSGSNAEEEFRKLRRVLGQCYEGLPDYDHKTCMLSLSIFPRNHPIKSKSLVRRLAAEGLVAGHGQKCLDELLNRCIVEPVQISSCSKDIKSCRVGGIMLEFIIHKSQSTNLVTLIRGEEVVRNEQARIRRLSVQSSTKDKVDEVAADNKLSETVRSLTIIPSEGRSELFKIERCRFLRLLDLEGCRGLNEEYFRGICELAYLKYLSLRRTDVENIPPEIQKLQCLQTLDIRGTTEIELPERVITLPELAFLFGLFVLPPEMSSGTKTFLKEKSKLHTLGELVVAKEGFEHTILEAKNLKKVKVSCRDTGALSKPQKSTKQKLVSSVSKTISKAIPKSLSETKKDFVSSLLSRFTSLDSLSIGSSQLNQYILACLERKEAPERRSTIRRMKLSGELVRLPCIDTLSNLDNLRKLQLSYTRLTSEVLCTLQHISALEYLKLQDNQKDSWVGSFVVRADGFESLRRLCFQASKLPKLEFEKESMKSLTSLHLLCPDISQMQVAEEISKSIEHITSLNEVILHSSASRETVEAWETAAKKNANRPRVNKLQELSSQRRDQ